LRAAAERVRRRAGGDLDAAVVLGSGLAAATLARIDGVDVRYDKLHAPQAKLAGHLGIARIGTWCAKRVAAFAGRVHLYQGFSAREVTYLVRLAAASGAKTLVLTNASGGLAPGLGRGDVVLVADQLNLTGVAPPPPSPDAPFLDMGDAYASRLRALARQAAEGTTLHEVVYAGMRGPQYETAAECEALRRLGADVVGMSTVLETIAARALGLEILGISLVSNVADGGPVDHASVVAAAEEGGERVANLVAGVLTRL
jgi:purine-nucleoside phosphorylase